MLKGALVSLLMLFASLPKYSDDREDLLTYLLTPHIIKAVDSYYGVPRGV